MEHEGDALGFSQVSGYDATMEAEIGARVRATIEEQRPPMTHREVAEAVHMTPDAFSRALSGKRAFSAIELVELADLLGTSSHWFVTGEPDPFSVRFAGRHTYDHDTKEHVPLEWGSVADVLARVSQAYVQVYGGDPLPRVGKAAKGAGAVRTELESEFGPDWVRHLADSIEQVFGIDIVRMNHIEQAFALEVLGRRVIVIGETGNWFFENWSLAHELAHVLYDDLSELGTSACDNPSAERAANRFAAELLLPATVLDELDWSTVGPAAIARFVWDHGVSTRSVANRLISEKVPTSPEARSALDQPTQRLLRSAWTEPDADDRIAERMQAAAARRFPATLISAHEAAVSEGRVNPAMLAWMLDVPVEPLAEELRPSVPEADLNWLAHELGLESD
ncbi:MAG: hypothetical protein JWP32_2851 [Schumannella sp.]|nr:hypothetical protein [Schumannella sp.]